MEFKVGDKVRLRKDSEFYESQGKIIGIGTIKHELTNDAYKWNVENLDKTDNRSYNDEDLELIESSDLIPNTKMTKKVMKVLVVDKKNGTITKDETVVADNEQHAILKAFGVDANDVHIKVTELSDYEETKPATVILEKEVKAKADK